MTPRCAAWITLVTVIAAATTAFADDDPQNLARTHFRRGLELVDEGAFEQAALEFQRAYELMPNFAVLYNTGQAYAAAGKPVEAVSALTKYLEEGGPKVPAPRRAEVLAEIQRQSTRVAEITIVVSQSDATVRVDGKEVGKSPLGAPIRVGAGEHVVSVARVGYTTSESTLTVIGEEKRRLVVELDAPVPTPLPAHLFVECALPGVRVLADGHPVATTPFAHELEIVPGAHVIGFERDGYRAEPRSIEVTPSGVARASCDLVPIAPVPESIAARLSIEPSERDAWIRVDRAPFASASTLPAGPHLVEVGKAGFETWTTEVDLAPGHKETVRVPLRPHPEYARAFEESAKRRRLFAYAVGAAGLATGAASLVVFLWNDARYHQWQQTQSSLNQEWRASSPPGSADLASRQQVNDDRIGTVHTLDAVTVALGIGGAALALTGAALFFTADDPGRYRLQLGPERAGLGWAF
jgi:hypothetical protein